MWVRIMYDVNRFFFYLLYKHATDHRLLQLSQVKRLGVKRLEVN